MIWILFVILIIASAVSKARKNGSAGSRANVNRPNTPGVFGGQGQTYSQSYPKNSSQAPSSYASQARSNGSPQYRAQYVGNQQYSQQYSQQYQSSANKKRGKSYAAGPQYGSTRVSGIRESSVLFEDRSNDWLARQLKEEAAILRRGSQFDLGASHSASCDATSLKRQHTRRHQSSGLDRGTFR